MYLSCTFVQFFFFRPPLPFSLRYEPHGPTRENFALVLCIPARRLAFGRAECSYSECSCRKAPSEAKKKLIATLPRLETGSNSVNTKEKIFSNRNKNRRSSALDLRSLLPASLPARLRCITGGPAHRLAFWRASPPSSLPLLTAIVTATRTQTEMPVSDRKQTIGPLSDRNTLPYFYFRHSFAFRPPDAHNRPEHKYYRVHTTNYYAPITSHRTSNRNYYGLEIDLTCCKQSPLIFSNRNKLRTLCFDFYSLRRGSMSRGGAEVVRWAGTSRGKPRISVGAVLAANSLCPEQEQQTMCALEVQTGNSG